MSQNNNTNNPFRKENKINYKAIIAVLFVLNIIFATLAYMQNSKVCPSPIQQVKQVYDLNQRSWNEIKEIKNVLEGT